VDAALVAQLGRKPVGLGVRPEEPGQAGAGDQHRRSWPEISDGPMRITHPEYNAGRRRSLVLGLGTRRTSESAIVVMDDKTRKLKAVIKDKRLITPTGKFNVFNTINDVY
jgi:hypothetical protein